MSDAPKKTIDCEEYDDDDDDDDDVEIQPAQTLQSGLDALNDYLKDLAAFKATFMAFHKRGKEIKKQIEKEMKQLQKNTITKRTRKPDAKPGGFQKPMRVSVQMLEFLGLPADKLIARTAVSKKLNEWIRDNDLQNPKDRRIIIPNDELLELFNDDYVEGCHLDFFTLQKYIKHHYIKDSDDMPSDGTTEK